MNKRQRFGLLCVISGLLIILGDTDLAAHIVGAVIFIMGFSLFYAD